jgi:hypothetical protein
MKKIYFIIFGLLLTGITSFSQTKIIAFKSHGGSAADFAAEFHGHFELLVGNLGLGTQQMTPQANLPEVDLASSKNKRLDSVRYFNDKLTVCYIAQYNKSAKKWNYGTDSVKNDAHFEKTNPLSSVKTYMRSNYYFKNNIYHVKFVGFDSHAGTRNNSTWFIAHYNEPNSGNKPLVVFVTCCILAIAGFISWRSYKSFKSA